MNENKKMATEMFMRQRRKENAVNFSQHFYDRRTSVNNNNKINPNVIHLRLLRHCWIDISFSFSLWLHSANVASSVFYLHQIDWRKIVIALKVCSSPYVMSTDYCLAFFWLILAVVIQPTIATAYLFVESICIVCDWMSVRCACVFEWAKRLPQLIWKWNE